MADYSKPPSTAKVQPQPFKVEIDANEIQSMKHLLAHSKLGPATYENQQTDGRFGINRDWLSKTKKHWETTYDWRRCEKEINSFPNFTIPVKDEKFNHEFTVHFIALFSTNPNAIPIALFHGWPGSILEFLPILNNIKKQYPTANHLPYHIIVPSLPGYAWSSPPPLDQDFKCEHIAPVMNNLMIALGFGESGYVAQGGDLGSFVSRQLAIEFDECKAFHVNLYTLPPPKNHESISLTSVESSSLLRGKAFRNSGSAYAQEHGTRTATIGLTISSSPLALLSWIGEKFLEWTDEDPHVDAILDSVSLYWLTETYAKCIYPYRTSFSGNPDQAKPSYVQPTSKPQGYSYFPKEIMPTPVAWVQENEQNLVFSARHESGGHFAAMEKPELLWGDVEAFVQKAWKGGEGDDDKEGKGAKI